MMESSDGKARGRGQNAQGNKWFSMHEHALAIADEFFGIAGVGLWWGCPVGLQNWRGFLELPFFSIMVSK